MLANRHQTMENVEGPNISDFLQCSICLGIYNEPTSLACSHTFCKMCIEQWVKEYRKTQCPVCNANLQPTHLRPAPSVFREMVSSLRVRCPNYQQGCQSTFPFERSDQRQTAHLNECQYEADLCNCGHLIVRAHMESHIQTDCEQTVVRCPQNCGKELSRKDMPNHSCVKELAMDAMTARKARDEQAMKMIFLSGSVSVLQQRLAQATTASSKLEQETKASLCQKKTQIEENARDLQALKRDTTSALTQILVWAMPVVRSLQERSIKSRPTGVCPSLTSQEQTLTFSKQSPRLLNSTPTACRSTRQTPLQNRSPIVQDLAHQRRLTSSVPQCYPDTPAKNVIKQTVQSRQWRSPSSPVWYCEWCLTGNRQNKVLCSTCSRRGYLPVSLDGSTPATQLDDSQGLWVCSVCQNINTHSDGTCKCGQQKAVQVFNSLCKTRMDIHQCLNRQLELWKKMRRIVSDDDSDSSHEHLVRVLGSFKYNVHQVLLRQLKLWTKLLPLAGTMR